MPYPGKTITLRQLVNSDTESVLEHINDAAVTRWTNIPYPYSRTIARSFIKEARAHYRKRKDFIFGIALPASDTVVGMIGLHEIDWKNRQAELGYWLGKNHWGKGIMTEAVQLTLSFGFLEMKLHKIHSRTFEENTASVKVYRRTASCRRVY